MHDFYLGHVLLVLQLKKYIKEKTDRCLRIFRASYLKLSIYSFHPNVKNIDSCNIILFNFLKIKDVADHLNLGLYLRRR